MPKKFQLNTKLNNNLIIYDYETCGRDPYETDPIEISAVAADMNTLELKKDNEGNVIVFSTLVRPREGTDVQEGALKKNNITLEMLNEKNEQGEFKIPDQKFAFEQFASFCRSFARSDKKWDQPYQCGFNINKFDAIISDQMCRRYDHMDKDGDPLLFHPFHRFDLMDYLRAYFAWGDDLAAYNLDAVRDYFGIAKTGSHRAEKDCLDCWVILKRFMNYFKASAHKMLPKFKGCFDESKQS